MSRRRIELIAEKITKLNRPQLIKMLRDLNCSFEMDFTDELLNSMSVERLRHVVMAGRLHDIDSRTHCA